MTQNDPQIEMMAVADLVPYARNSRTHDDAQVAQIAASIREFGFTNPVLIDADGGIIAGHGRVLLFDPTDAKSSAYNPLLEVRRGDWEVRDVQNIADILVDPEGALDKQIGRASCAKECTMTCRSRWSPYH